MSEAISIILYITKSDNKVVKYYYRLQNKYIICFCLYKTYFTVHRFVYFTRHHHILIINNDYTILSFIKYDNKLYEPLREVIVFGPASSIYHEVQWNHNVFCFSIYVLYWFK